MKIRQGFVSNSSSSSFCIFGIVLSDFGCTWKRDTSKLEGLNYENGIGDYYEDDLIIGFHADKILKYEKVSKFKQDIVDKLKKIKPDITIDDIECHTDGGYNG